MARAYTWKRIVWMSECYRDFWLARAYIERVYPFRDTWILDDSNDCRDAIEVAADYHCGDWGPQILVEAWQQALKDYERRFGKPPDEKTIAEAADILLKAGFEPHEIPIPNPRILY